MPGPVKWVGIWHCHSCGIGGSHSSDLISGLGDSKCCGRSLKRKKKNSLQREFPSGVAVKGSGVVPAMAQATAVAWV